MTRPRPDGRLVLLLVWLPAVCDALWRLAWRRLTVRAADEPLLELLRGSLRAGQEIDDAALLAPAWAKTYSVPGALGMMRSVRDELEGEGRRRRAQRVIEAVRKQLR